MIDFIENIEEIYRNTSDKEKAIKDFFAPCLKLAKRYDRSAAFYSSTSLITFLSSLPDLVKGEKKIRLIIRKELSEEDRKIIGTSNDPDQKSKLLKINTEEMLLNITKLNDDNKNLNARAKILSWLIAKGIIEIRIGTPTHYKESEYHDKFGIFYFDENIKVGFNGSSNESLRGHFINSETITVFKTYNDIKSSHLTKLEDFFEQDWSNNNNYFRVEEPSLEILKAIENFSPESDIDTYLNVIKEEEKDNSEYDNDEYLNPPERYSWQNEARRLFVDKHNRGIFNVATGCGKTFLALAVAAELFTSNKIQNLIICTQKSDVLEQWWGELKKWKKARPNTKRVPIYKDYGETRELNSALNQINSSGIILLINYWNFSKFLKRTKDSKSICNNTLIIHDEVHNYSTPGIIKDNSGLQANFKFVLGLSATVHHEFHDERNEFINQEIGKVVYEFSLEEAIQKKILCDFNYIVIPYVLTDKEKARKSKLYSDYQTGLKEKIKPRNILIKELRIALSNVNKWAVIKEKNFLKFIYQDTAHLDYLKKSFVFTLLEKRADEITNSLKENTDLKVGTYYRETNKKHLENFNNGIYDNLIIVEMLSEGISINELQNVIIFDGSSGHRDVIQRIGRALRIDLNNPNKTATVIDFIHKDKISGDNSDEYSEEKNKEIIRLNWLRSIAKNYVEVKLND
tara:strand:- start:96 stop:2153 length:2058 start_codon:yes stop_codon:yes gene_type:complete